MNNPGGCETSENRGLKPEIKPELKPDTEDCQASAPYEYKIIGLTMSGSGLWIDDIFRSSFDKGFYVVECDFVKAYSGLV